MVSVVVLGHILNEKIVFPDKEIFPVLGSPVAYSSVCMSSLGVEVGIVTKIGEDFPEELLAVFLETGVDIKGISYCKHSTNNKLIYDIEGKKTLEFLSKADDIKFNDIPELYKQAKLFSVSPMNYEVSLRTIKEIYKLEKKMSVDIGGYGGGTSDTHPRIKDGNEIKNLCPFFNIVKGSIEDFGHIFGENTSEIFISEKIIEWGAEICVITLGGKGSFVSTYDNRKYISTYPIKRHVDQTGAGDCYFGGFLTKFLEKYDPFEAALYGTAATSYVIERSGGVVAQRMPDIKEVKRRINKIKILNFIIFIKKEEKYE